MGGAPLKICFVSILIVCISSFVDLNSVVVINIAMEGKNSTQLKVGANGAVQNEISETEDDGNRDSMIFESPNIDGMLSLDNNICQVRIDFIDFDLPDRVAGECPAEQFVIHGPKVVDGGLRKPLCGYMTGQHVYLPTAGGVSHFNIQNRPSDSQVTYKMKFTNIYCNDPHRAPENCLQYYKEPIGRIMTFNYKHDNVGYFNNSNYDICIKQNHGYCEIEYHKPEHCGFNIENHDVRDLVFTGEDCIYDYAIFGGEKICGHVFPDKITADPQHSLFRVTFFSDESVQFLGFNISYRQVLC